MTRKRPTGHIESGTHNGTAPCTKTRSPILSSGFASAFPVSSACNQSLCLSRLNFKFRVRVSTPARTPRAVTRTCHGCQWPNTAARLEERRNPSVEEREHFQGCIFSHPCVTVTGSARVGTPGRDGSDPLIQSSSSSSNDYVSLKIYFESSLPECHGESWRLPVHATTADPGPDHAGPSWLGPSLKAGSKHSRHTRALTESDTCLAAGSKSSRYQVRLRIPCRARDCRVNEGACDGHEVRVATH
jgi:hypothetical protein